MLFALMMMAAAQEPPAPGQNQPQPPGYRPPATTIVAEPVALFLAGLDRDRDGRTTRAELQKGLDEVTADWRDGIGYIAFADWSSKWLGDRNGVPTPFEVDRNGDNRITRDELVERMTAIFDRYDLDKDGAVTRAELLTIRATPFGERPDRRGRGRGGEGERPPQR